MNTIDISYDVDSFKKLAPKKFVIEFLNKVLNSLELSNVEFSVSFVEEDSMHEMNKQYRNIDDSTDILSFAAEDELDDEFAFISKGRRKRVLGDMIICPAVLERNAKTFGVTSDEELRRLLIHGVLHLSGCDHKTNDPSEPMLIKQESILASLSV